MNDVLTIKDLHFAYEKKEILCSVDLNIKKKDFFVLTGDNGSGKSTLLKCILGFLDPQIGDVKLNTDKIGYIPQTGLTSLKDFPASVYEVVAMRLEKTNFFNINSKPIQKAVKSALEKVGIEDLRKKRISDLSGGQLQRVLIARELVSKIDFLILDEPTTGLDQKSIQSLLTLLKSINEEGMTIGMVSHYIDDVKDSATHIYRLKDTHLVEVNYESI